MPDKKISELLAASSPIDGSETFPVVQGAATKKITAKEIVKFGYQDVVTDNTSARTLSFADRGAWLRFTNATAATLTVPTNASAAFGIGESVNGIQGDAGKITITPASGVTINYPADYKNNTRVQFSPFCLIKVGTDTWDLMGDLEAI